MVRVYNKDPHSAVQQLTLYMLYLEQLGYKGWKEDKAKNLYKYQVATALLVAGSTLTL